MSSVPPPPRDSREPVVEVRRMRAEDLEAVAAVWQAAFAPLQLEPRPRTAEEQALDLRRRRYLLDSDPEGSFVALLEDEVVGLAQSHLRDGVFVLAMLGVRPDQQDRGIGGRLLELALSHGRDARAAYVFSSSDPRAMHRYVAAGFDLHPAVVLRPRPATERAEMPEGVHRRSGDGATLRIVERIDRDVRGGARTGDVDFLLQSGNALVLEDHHDGYAIVGSERLVTLAARTEDAARRLLASAMCGTVAEQPVEVSWVTAAQQWAIRAASELGAAVEVHGAVMTRGIDRLPSPYLPSGLFG